MTTGGMAAPGGHKSIDDLIRLSGVSARVARGDGSTRVTDVTHDSRRVTAGSLFCCVRGASDDGHRFAAEAVRAGAVALLVEEVVDDLPGDITGEVVQVVVDDSRSAMGHLASAFHGFPSRHMAVVGVTGTNGKTTTCHLISAVLRHAGMSIATLGTLHGRFTTPEATDLQREFASLLNDGVRAVVMEVSSHALELDRVTGTTFAAAVFTNLSQDHLDFHGDMESYFGAKARLFTTGFTPVGVVNADDDYGRRLLATSPVRTVGFSSVDASNVVVTPVEVAFDWRGRRLSLAMGGRVNLMNALAAVTTCRELGIDEETIAEGLARAPQVRGRYEQVDIGTGFVVIVDYAHTPDGLFRLLDSLRESRPAGRILVVFGCGGDRDVAKRPLMGAIAAGGADAVFVTSDNPRSEDPQSIVDAIVAGVASSERGKIVLVDTDRRRAIHAALSSARDGDVVVIAGKGHEVTQTIGSEVLPFDDRLVVREWKEGAR